MGKLSFPKGSTVYLDTQIVIYSVETHSRYWPLLEPLWLESQAGNIQIATSELTPMEALVAPIRKQDLVLLNAYDRLLCGTESLLLPVSREVLIGAARLRANYSSLRGPDAIHLSSAREYGCSAFLKNDVGCVR